MHSGASLISSPARLDSGDHRRWEEPSQSWTTVDGSTVAGAREDDVSSFPGAETVKRWEVVGARARDYKVHPQPLAFFSATCR